MSNIVICYVPVALNITLTVEKRGFGDTKSWKKTPRSGPSWKKWLLLSKTINQKAFTINLRTRVMHYFLWKKFNSFFIFFSFLALAPNCYFWRDTSYVWVQFQHFPKISSFLANCEATWILTFGVSNLVLIHFWWKETMLSDKIFLEWLPEKLATTSYFFNAWKLKNWSWFWKKG